MEKSGAIRYFKSILYKEAAPINRGGFFFKLTNKLNLH